MIISDVPDSPGGMMPGSWGSSPLSALPMPLSLSPRRRAGTEDSLVAGSASCLEVMLSKLLFPGCLWVFGASVAFNIGASELADCGRLLPALSEGWVLSSAGSVSGFEGLSLPLGAVTGVLELAARLAGSVTLAVSC